MLNLCDCVRSSIIDLIRNRIENHSNAPKQSVPLLLVHRNTSVCVTLQISNKFFFSVSIDWDILRFSQFKMLVSSARYLTFDCLKTSWLQVVSRLDSRSSTTWVKRLCLKFPVTSTTERRNIQNKDEHTKRAVNWLVLEGKQCSNTYTHTRTNTFAHALFRRNLPPSFKRNKSDNKFDQSYTLGPEHTHTGS